MQLGTNVFLYSLPDDATIEYEILNRGFYDLLRTYYCDFSERVLCREVCYLTYFVVMGFCRYCSASQ